MPEQQPNESPGKNAKPKKVRLDARVAAQYFDGDRERARRSIMAGEVRVEGVLRDTPSTLVAATQTLTLHGGDKYVSRGGHKLAHALDRAGLDAAGMVAVDIGASTGGFSDVLLQRGVTQLFAVDVGYGDLAWKIRSDARVTTLERTNVRHLAALPGGALADIAVIDASFIGLDMVLPAAARLLRPTAQVVALVKPQFEAARGEVGEGGVVRDEAVHARVLAETIRAAESLEFTVAGLYASPILGPAGNVEFLLWLVRGAAKAPPIEVASAIEAALDEARRLRAA